MIIKTDHLLDEGKVRKVRNRKKGEKKKRSTALSKWI